MNELWIQDTELLLVLMKAIVNCDDKSIDFEKHIIKTEIIKILAQRIIS